ncbi:MerR family DNA-binding transcriptional regulator [Streptomyces sp. NPDC014622]|uniref:MerR family DNA-binding transcriptional regulator n=1 Tax=Streptomyces sp. NPDC014622 TaxID=3364874 RepID=UPI0037007C2E
MRTGEIAARTDTPVRLLRYYEERGLIEPQRLSNGATTTSIWSTACSRYAACWMSVSRPG